LKAARQCPLGRRRVPADVLHHEEARRSGRPIGGDSSRCRPGISARKAYGGNLSHGGFGREAELLVAGIGTLYMLATLASAEATLPQLGKIVDRISNLVASTGVRSCFGKRAAGGALWCWRLPVS
jgi:hypothetical protein